MSMYDVGNKAKTKKGKKEQLNKEQAETKSVLFMEHTKEGELARKMRDLMKRLAPKLGFSI